MKNRPIFKKFRDFQGFCHAKTPKFGLSQKSWPMFTDFLGKKRDPCLRISCKKSDPLERHIPQISTHLQRNRFSFISTMYFNIELDFTSHTCSPLHFYTSSGVYSKCTENSKFYLHFVLSSWLSCAIHFECTCTM